MVFSIKKEGSILSLILDYGEAVQIDCKDFTITSYTGRKVKHLPSRCRNSQPNLNYKCLYSALCQAVEHQNFEPFRKVELFLQYPERLPLTLSTLPDECPKGYVKWVLEQDTTFTKASLSNFKRWQKIPPKYYILYNVITSYGVDALPLSSPSEIETFFKFIEYHFTKQPDTAHRLYTLVDRIKECKDNNIDWLQYFNPHHTFKSNIETLTALLNQETKNKKLEERQSRILPISEIESNNFVVIVPTSVSQLADEGNQQNNCVGYYYNEGIINGKQLIYFIRKKDSPEDSYLTCRYFVPGKHTSEHRFFNNVDCTLSKYPELNALVEKIDQKIVEILQG